MKTETYQFRIPTHLTYSLIYADDDSLTEDDELVLEEIENKVEELVKQHNGTHHTWEFDDFSDFEPFPDFGRLACDCTISTLTIFIKE